MKSRRVLVTGATGLIGRQTVLPLKARGFTVIAMTHGKGAVADADETIVGDLLDSAAMKSVVREAAASHLVHLAWHGDISNRWNSLANLDWAGATLQLVHRFAEEGGKGAVLAGSCAEYDWGGGGSFAEDDDLGPRSLYGQAKAATGVLLTSASQHLGMTLAWARIFFCYGPGESQGRLIGDLVSGLSANRIVECTDGQQLRDFLHTADIGKALATLLDAGAAGAVNVGSGTAVPVARVIQTVARVMGKPELIRLGAQPRPPDDPACIEAVVTRLTSEFGFKPEIDLETGLENVIQREVGNEQPI